MRCADRFHQTKFGRGTGMRMSGSEPIMPLNAALFFCLICACNANRTPFRFSHFSTLGVTRRS